MDPQSIGADQNNPYWLIEIKFLGEIETVIKSDPKSRFGFRAISICGTISGPAIFLFNMTYKILARGKGTEAPSTRGAKLPRMLLQSP